MATALAGAVVAQPGEARADPNGDSMESWSGWNGVWQGGGMVRPFSAHLVSLDYISGTVDVAGLCTAQWSERQRLSDTHRIVAASVLQGPCVDNVWDVTITPTMMVGRDSSGTEFRLTRQ